EGRLGGRPRSLWRWRAPRRPARCSLEGDEPLPVDLVEGELVQAVVGLADGADADLAVDGLEVGGVHEVLAERCEGGPELLADIVELHALGVDAGCDGFDRVDGGLVACWWVGEEALERGGGGPGVEVLVEGLSL